MPPGSFFGIPGEAGQEPEYPPLEQDEPKVNIDGEFKERHVITMFQILYAFFPCRQMPRMTGLLVLQAQPKMSFFHWVVG